MDLKLNRKYLGDNYTIGDLFINEVFYCNTLEDKVRDLNKDGDLNDLGESKIYAQTAIPYGKYKITLNKSPRFKRDLPRLLDVPHFEGILIHRGNTAEDSAGCILVGENKIKGMVINSTKYELDLVNKMREEINKGGTITINIMQYGKKDSKSVNPL